MYGVGAALLRHIFNTARERNYQHVSLETGSGESFDAANALYLRFGFQPCGPFGTYVDDPFSRFYSIAISDWEPIGPLRQRVGGFMRGEVTELDNRWWQSDDELGELFDA